MNDVASPLNPLSRKGDLPLATLDKFQHYTFIEGGLNYSYNLIRRGNGAVPE